MAEPIRTCLGCRQRAPKRTLLRLAAPADGPILVDPSGKHPGRGAYVCPRQECIDAALHPKRLQRAFRRPIDERVILRLRSQLTEVLQA